MASRPYHTSLVKTQIFGEDNRTAVPDTTTYPWSAVGRILSFYGNEIHAGTGAVIGNDTVLTVAHVVYDQSLGRPDSIQFIPGLNGSQEPFGRVDVTAASVPQPFIDNGNEDYDIAVLKLDHPIGGQTGVLPFNVVTSGDLAGQTLLSAGYPSDLEGGISMFSAAGPFLGVDGNMLLEQIDTEPGQSGSPIWRQAGGNITVVATVVGTRQTTSGLGQVTVEGVGTYIDSEILRWINAAATGEGSTSIGTTSDTQCGMGILQAFGVLSLSWAACVISRRGGYRQP